MRASVLKSVVGIALVCVTLLLPLSLMAQTQGELESTIRAAILSDPRTSQMTEAEIDAMVSALATEAAEQGVTPQDIAWRPQEFTAGQAVGATCNMLCQLTHAFGFDGSDIKIPIALGTSAALLLFIIGSMLHHQHEQHPIAGSIASSQNLQSSPK